MAKVEIPKAQPTPLEVPDARAREIIAAEARKGTDAGLAAKDRRDRAAISPRTSHAPSSVLQVDGEARELLGPGKGEGWMLLAWVDPEIGPCYGTYPEDLIERVVREGPARGEPVDPRPASPTRTGGDKR